MKLIYVVIAVLALAGLASAKPKIVITKPVVIRVQQPEIVYQDTDREGAVKVRIWNPLKNDVWVKLECFNVISQDIRVPHGTHNVYITAEEPITPDPCFIMKWEEIVR